MLNEVFTKVEVKIEVDKVACDLKKYVNDTIAVQAAPFLSQNSEVQPRVKNEPAMGTKARTRARKPAAGRTKLVIIGVSLVVAESTNVPRLLLVSP